ncbi:MAG: 50S ribosomal protein L19 [Tissierellia bacterium]|nr:50S ribosomal protein L19 [Tissierellia bacterium]
MNYNIIRDLEREGQKKDLPSFNVGDTVRVSERITEGKRQRIQVFEGLVIKRQGGGISERFTVRKLSGNVGVEKTFPLHSPKIEGVEVIRRGKVRRARLYYIRDRVGKAAKVKERIR